MKDLATTFFWFRRDLRLQDNHGLYRALKENEDVQPLFIFDENILNGLPSEDARVTFLHDTLGHLKSELQSAGKDVSIYYGDPVQIWTALMDEYNISAVYTNHDYEPYAISRDLSIKNLLDKRKIKFKSYKDHVLFEKKEILTNAGGVYTVFTPYKRKWLVQFQNEYVERKPKSGSFYPSEDYLHHLACFAAKKIPTLQMMGFNTYRLDIPDQKVPQKVIKHYADRRNYPGLKDSTSKLGVHFRFGTISIRDKALKAASLSDTYLNELIWRDFYAQILANFPHVVNGSFRLKYDSIPWRYDDKEFDLWCHGMTGYPLVDAGMRELNATGYMHNRVRMITASFLTKHLLMDWRLGEAYFALKLLDFDLASNNGGWQWAAGSGTDAAPYFRVFNPTSQMERYDKDRTYVKKWVPEYDTEAYPKPMIDHKVARERCLNVYKSALNNN